MNQSYQLTKNLVKWKHNIKVIKQQKREKAQVKYKHLRFVLQFMTRVNVHYSITEWMNTRNLVNGSFTDTSSGNQLFKCTVLLLWQDLLQHRRTWSTTSTRPQLAWSGAHQQTMGGGTMSPIGLFAGVAVGNLRSAFHVGWMWDTLLHSQD